MTGVSLDAAVAALAPLDEVAMAEARRHQDRLTKPPGSLGRLEELAVLLAGVRGDGGRPLGPAGALVCAADHGVAAEGVSAYPSAVTAQMVANFLDGGAAISVLARSTGARMLVLDVGVAAPIPGGDRPRLLRRAERPGTANIVRQPAMSRAEARSAVEAGIEAAWLLAGEGCEVLLLGDMGIANTTAASALVAALCDAPAAAVCGRGTGVDEAGLARKVAAVDAAVRRASLAPDADGLTALSELGGLEIAALAGALIGGAARRMLVILDGHPSTAAALVARRLAPHSLAVAVAGHLSAEPGHAIALGHLGLRPLLDLDLRLGEGTGAALAYGLVVAAADLHAGMATFDSAGVSDRTGDALPDATAVRA